MKNKYLSSLLSSGKFEIYFFLIIFFFMGWLFFKVLMPIINKLLHVPDIIDDEERVKEEKSQVEKDIVFYEKTEDKTYPDAQYSNWANGIYNSVGYAWDDDEEVKKIFRKLKNNLDFLYLTKAFGRRESGIPLTYRSMSLYIQYYYVDEKWDEDVINTFNFILKKNNIKYRI